MYITKRLMLTIIYLLNDKNIKYGHIFLLIIFIVGIGYVNPYLLSIFFIDIYLLLSITQFNIIIPDFKNIPSKIKLNISLEETGIEKDKHDVKDIFLNYLSKFS